MPSKIFWTRQAQDDLRAIRAHIARDAPATAAAYVSKLRLSVSRLRHFPSSGAIVIEVGKEKLRELFQGNYRIIYRISDQRVDILAIFHGARIFDERDLGSLE